MFLLPIAVLAAGGSNEILLWPNGAPGSEGKTSDETVRIYQPTGDHVITRVNNPSIVFTAFNGR
jgi:endo-1,4-beta-xylanase